MGKAGYNIATGADVALAIDTAKSVLGVKANAAFGVDLLAAGVQFDGTTGGARPVLIELCGCTWATNPPGTNSTTVTPVQGYGPRLTHGLTAARGWTTEPTALTVLDEWRIHPQSGIIVPLPLGNTYDSALSEGFVLRCTAHEVVNMRASFRVERA